MIQEQEVVSICTKPAFKAKLVPIEYILTIPPSLTLRHQYLFVPRKKTPHIVLITVDIYEFTCPAQ